MSNHHESLNQLHEESNFSSRFPNPEPSEEPILKNTSGVFEVNSSLQGSTHQSSNLRSFSLISPKRSYQSTPHLLANKIRELQGQTSSPRLSYKIKSLEASYSIKKTEPVIDTIESHEYKPKDSETALEGENDVEIPSLRWCAYCKGETKTDVMHVNNGKTFWSSVGIFMSGGVLGCFLLPYLTNHCKGIRLVCHKCRRPVG